MPHRLVEEDARPARAQHHRELARGRLDGVELDHGLAHGLGRVVAPALVLEEEVEGDATAAAIAAHLALAVLFHDHGDVEPGQRPDIAHRPAGRRGDEHHHVLAAQARDDLPHARIGCARGGIHLAEELDLAVEGRGDGRFGESVEIVRLAAAHRHHGRGRGGIRDGTGLAGRFLEIGQRQIIGVRVARALSRLRADARALAHMARGLLDGAFLENQLLADAVLEEEIGVIDPPCQL